MIISIQTTRFSIARGCSGPSVITQHNAFLRAVWHALSITGENLQTSADRLTCPPHSGTNIHWQWSVVHERCPHSISTSAADADAHLSMTPTSAELSSVMHKRLPLAHSSFTLLTLIFLTSSYCGKLLEWIAYFTKYPVNQRKTGTLLLPITSPCWPIKHSVIHRLSSDWMTNW